MAGNDRFCFFRPLTLVPIDLGSFSLDTLSPEEIGWLDACHARVRQS
nr:M24 family metallopeptidase C-terminal domain-containing protein [uncultured Cohaesibacter sp.]